MWGTPKNGNDASFVMHRVGFENPHLASQTRGESVASAYDVSVDSAGSKALYVTTTNRLVCADVRTGRELWSLPNDRPRKGACWDRFDLTFLTAEFYDGTWKAVEYDSVDRTVLKATDLAPFGVTQVNTCLFTSTNRHIAVGHTNGTLMIDKRDYLEWVLPTPQAGNVKMLVPSPNNHMICGVGESSFTMNVIMTQRYGDYWNSVVWDQIGAVAFNWDAYNENRLYPDFLVAGRQGSQWRIRAYELLPNSLQDDKRFVWDYHEEITGIQFSDLIKIDDNFDAPSFYGRALVVFGVSGYTILNLVTGEILDQFTTPNLGQIKSGFWRLCAGV